mmetsp:Transcript_17550/g.21436  ORF Transcript_17550/g.21436 Transcript_17550/m.21436 type:complete len:274 (+) Transcript_17550:303-1124(+)
MPEFEAPVPAPNLNDWPVPPVDEASVKADEGPGVDPNVKAGLEVSGAAGADVSIPLLTAAEVSVSFAPNLIDEVEEDTFDVPFKSNVGALFFSSSCVALLGIEPNENPFAAGGALDIDDVVFFSLFVEVLAVPNVNPPFALSFVVEDDFVSVDVDVEPNVKPPMPLPPLEDPLSFPSFFDTSNENLVASCELSPVDVILEESVLVIPNVNLGGSFLSVLVEVVPPNENVGPALALDVSIVELPVDVNAVLALLSSGLSASQHGHFNLSASFVA